MKFKILASLALALYTSISFAQSGKIYDVKSLEVNDLISKRKYKDNPYFAKSTSGHVMFQHYGQKGMVKKYKD